MAPSFCDGNGQVDCSVISSASMSALRATQGPGSAPCRRNTAPVSGWLPCRGMPSSDIMSFIYFVVSYSLRLISGCLCRCMRYPMNLSLFSSAMSATLAAMSSVMFFPRFFMLSDL